MRPGGTNEKHGTLGLANEKAGGISDCNDGAALYFGSGYYLCHSSDILVITLILKLRTDHLTGGHCGDKSSGQG